MTANSALDSLLDSTLDDLADLPTFQPYPAGAHRCTIEFEEKVINRKPAVELKLIGISTEELADPAEDKPIEPKQETQVLYILTKEDGSVNEVSQGKLKEVLKPLGEATGATSIRAIMAASKGMEVLAITKKRHNKTNDTYNTDIVKLEVV